MWKLPVDEDTSAATRLLSQNQGGLSSSLTNTSFPIAQPLSCCPSTPLGRTTGSARFIIGRRNATRSNRDRVLSTAASTHSRPRREQQASQTDANVLPIALNDTRQMTKTASKIRFKAKLTRPAESEKGESWTFLTLPKNASAKLPSRSMTAIEGTINGFAFRATLEPDGEGSHWLKVDREMREAAGAEAGDLVTLEIAPAADEPEPSVPTDLETALAAAAPKARALWSDITPIARRDWIHWITSAKKAETRVRRVANACSMLAAGKRRACCFDRSGMYSKSMSAPKAAP